MTDVTLSINIAHPMLPTVLSLLGMTVPPPAPVNPATPLPSVPAGSHMDTEGFAVLDDRGAAVVADAHNASAPYLAGLRLIASKPDVTEAELMKAVGAATPDKLAGHKASTAKRAKKALGKGGAVLFRIKNGKVVVADQTRKALARYFGLPET